MPSLVAIDAPISCESCPIGRHAVYAPAFANMPNEITVRRRAQSMLGPRQTIVREGEIPKSVYTLFSGWAYRCKTLPDGGRQILSFYIPGDILTVQSMSREPLPFSVRALTNVVLCAFDRERFFDFLMRTDALRESLYRDLLGQYDEADQTLVDVGRRPAIARVARFLLSMEQRLRKRGMTDNGKFELPISQSMIADSLGLTPVYVNRTLVIMRASGAIDFRRNEMIIQDFGELRAFAETE